MPGPHPRRSDHPYLVESLLDLPDGLRQLAEQTLRPDEPAETIFVMPAQSLPKNFGGRGGMHLVPERALLFTAQGVLFVQDVGVSGLPGQAIYFRADQVLYTRLILVLLYGRLEFYGVAGDTLKGIVMEYNTVGQDLLQPALQRFLRMVWGKLSDTAESDDRTEDLLQALGQQSFKFKNGLRLFALTPGERLSSFVFQPRIVKRILGIFPRLAVPAALLALTENQIILIEEGRTNATSYGWFITFCPRRYITGVEMRMNADWQDVHIHMKKGDLTAEHQVTLENTAAQAWQSMWSSHA